MRRKGRFETKKQKDVRHDGNEESIPPVEIATKPYLAPIFTKVLNQAFRVVYYIKNVRRLRKLSAINCARIHGQWGKCGWWSVDISRITTKNFEPWVTSMLKLFICSRGQGAQTCLNNWFY